ncbi:universal stress protein [Microvirga flavescens]|uniref:universal stress protein n=1 Tax=Microvirga flavescens TaxID=2249811 RepID=UPI000DD9ED81|nr:universal stress protein [Microvirga flavescens]
MYTKILIATDGSPLSVRAVEHGVALAKAVGASVCFVTVTDRFHIFSFETEQLEATRGTFRKEMREQAVRRFTDAVRIAEAQGVPFTKVHLEEDEPYLGILSTAERQGCDLIVMASHGRSGVSALLLGSETTKVLTHSKIPVLVVR